MRAPRLLGVLVMVGFGPACGSNDDGNVFATGAGSTSAGLATTGDAEATGSGEGESEAGSDGETGAQIPKLDVAAGTGGPMGGGCKKVDFLFVIDNSGSMKEEQQQLIASFPGFVAAIEDSVAVDDFHVMVVDADDWFAIDQCQGICPGNPEDTCVACADDDQECLYMPCEDFPPPLTCEGRIGAGRVTTPGGTDCGVVGDGRYLTSAQPDLGAAFSCIAAVGIGASAERPMDAMVTALGSMQAPGECNEGFLRDDAILIVTVISDEEDSDADDGIASAGNPAAWKQALVDAKNGDENAVVFLGLLGDTGLPNAICQGGNMPQAADAPRLRELAESFPHGQWHSVCTNDYAPFFEESIAVIDTACDEFEPAG